MSLRHVIQNWRSTLAGLAMILAAIARIHSVADLQKTDIQASLCGGVGLVMAADGKRSESKS